MNLQMFSPATERHHIISLLSHLKTDLPDPGIICFWSDTVLTTSFFEIPRSEASNPSVCNLRSFPSLLIFIAPDFITPHFALSSFVPPRASTRRYENRERTIWQASKPTSQPAELRTYLVFKILVPYVPDFYFQRSSRLPPSPPLHLRLRLPSHLALGLAYWLRLLDHRVSSFSSPRVLMNYDSLGRSGWQASLPLELHSCRNDVFKILLRSPVLSSESSLVTSLEAIICSPSLENSIRRYRTNGTVFGLCASNSEAPKMRHFVQFSQSSLPDAIYACE